MGITNSGLDQNYMQPLVQRLKLSGLRTSMNDGDSGIVAVHVMTPSGVVRLE